MSRSWSVTNVLLVLVALAAFGVAGVLAIRPEVMPPEALEFVVQIEDAVEPQQVVIGIAAVVGLFAMWRSYFSGATDVQDEGISRESAGEDATVAVVGETTNERVDRTIESLKHGQRADLETEAVADDVRATLLAVEDAKGRSKEEANERLRSGAWTDDRVAAVFLGDDAAGRLSIWHRLRMWLFPGRTFDRRLERTLEELERYATESTATAGVTDGIDDETEPGQESEREGESGSESEPNPKTAPNSEGNHA